MMKGKTSKSDKTADPETVKADLESIQAKIYNSRAERKELSNRLIDARAFRSEDVERVISQYIGTCRSRLWAIPNALPRLLLGLATVEAITAELRAAVEEAVAELLPFDADAFRSRSIDYATIEPEESDTE
jgi:hypothetical protein